MTAVHSAYGSRSAVVSTMRYLKHAVAVLCCLFRRASTVPLRRASDWQVETVVRLRTLLLLFFRLLAGTACSALSSA